MADGETDLHPTGAKLLFALIILTTTAQIMGFFSRTWACKEEKFAVVTNVTKCDMQGLFYQCTNRGCYGKVIDGGIFGPAVIAFVLDLGIGGYLAYRILINGDSIAWIWHYKQQKIALSAVYIISQLLAGIGFFITLFSYTFVGWSLIVFSLPGVVLICIVLTLLSGCVLLLCFGKDIVSRCFC